MISHFSIGRLSHSCLYALSVLAMAIMDALAKGASSVPIAQTLLVRGLIACTVIVFVARSAGFESPVRIPRRAGLQTLRGLLVAGTVATFFLSLRELPLADATAIAMIAPLLLVLAGRLVLNEPLRPAQLLACAIGFAGMLLIVQPGGAGAAAGSHGGWLGLGTGAWLALASAVLYVALVLVTRVLGVSSPATTTAWYGNAVVTLLCAALLAFQGWTPPTASQWATLAGLGIAAAVSNLLHTQALRGVEVGQAGTLDYSILVWAALLGWIFWGDLPGPATIAGSLLIAGAGISAMRAGARAAGGRR
ncbi:DMT family transporter [Zeimonas arvi]|uniref:DMT family transporter n=1 Tax=Zeimonas arvi TaxID=2498847 RepID=UPI001CECC063|nr:DMT family transporter [Zeimonas arvi]